MFNFTNLYTIEDLQAIYPVCLLCNHACEFIELQYQDFIKCNHCDWRLLTWKEYGGKGRIDMLECNNYVAQYKRFYNPRVEGWGTYVNNEWFVFKKNVCIDLTTMIKSLQQDLPKKMAMLQ
jgi:DNA-directed RNA polymerase subunit RPC12/RpoP